MVIQEPPGASLPEGTLLKLIRGLHRERAFQKSVPLMREFIRRFPERAAPVRLT